jgi:hypothetical protein
MADFAEAEIHAAVQRGSLTVSDAARLSEHLGLPDGVDARSATQLFSEALDDPESSPLALGLLSVAKYKEQSAATDETPAHKALGQITFGLGIALGGGLVYLGLEAALHSGRTPTSA